MQIVKDTMDEQYRVYDSNGTIKYIVPSYDLALHYLIIDLTEKLEQLEKKLLDFENYLTSIKPRESLKDFNERIQLKCEGQEIEITDNKLKDVLEKLIKQQKDKL